MALRDIARGRRLRGFFGLVQLALGNLQAICLCEFDGPRERELRIVVR
jgi:hypothetical protein